MKKLFIELTFRKKPDMFAHYLLVKEQNNTLGQNRLQVVSFPTKKFYNIDQFSKGFVKNDGVFWAKNAD
jgi:hypothetical protein